MNTYVCAMDSKIKGLNDWVSINLMLIYINFFTNKLVNFVTNSARKVLFIVDILLVFYVKCIFNSSNAASLS